MNILRRLLVLFLCVCYLNLSFAVQIALPDNPIAIPNAPIAIPSISIAIPNIIYNPLEAAEGGEARFLNQPQVSSDLSIFGDRIYSNKLGRFLTIDSKDAILSSYGYTSGNPIQQSDRSGDSPLGWILGALALVVGAITVVGTGGAAAPEVIAEDTALLTAETTATSGSGLAGEAGGVSSDVGSAGVSYTEGGEASQKLEGTPGEISGKGAKKGKKYFRSVRKSFSKAARSVGLKAPKGVPGAPIESQGAVGGSIENPINQVSSTSFKMKATGDVADREAAEDAIAEMLDSREAKQFTPRVKPPKSAARSLSRRNTFSFKSFRRIVGNNGTEIEEDAGDAPWGMNGESSSGQAEGRDMQLTDRSGGGNDGSTGNGLGRGRSAVGANGGRGTGATMDTSADVDDLGGDRIGRRGARGTLRNIVNRLQTNRAAGVARAADKSIVTLSEAIGGVGVIAFIGIGVGLYEAFKNKGGGGGGGGSTAWSVIVPTPSPQPPPTP